MISIKKLIPLALALPLSLVSVAQMTIKGKVTEGKDKPVPFVTVYIKNTITGALTDSLGRYSMHLNKKGNATIIATTIGYDTAMYNLMADTSKTYIVNLSLHSNSSNLDEVTISPGSMAASNDRKVAQLTTLDVYTTASANGDVVGALQTLPGLQKVSDQTGLFVRGGDATESAAIVDGLVVQDPFFSPVPGVAQRSRFGPYEFKGISFSSGGYSARYGQALSGILELNTNDLPEQTTLNANVNMAGAGLSGSYLMEHSAIEGGFNYTNTTPFYSLTKTNIDFFQPPVGYSGNLRYVWSNKGDILKIEGTADQYKSGTDVIDPDQPDTTLSFHLQNFYTAASLYYRHIISTSTFLTVGASYSQNGDTVHWGAQNFDKQDYRSQARVELDKQFGNKLFTYIGTEVSQYGEKQQFDSAQFSFKETQAAAYAEAEWKPFKWFGLKPGIRYEYSEILAKSDLAPRISAAVRLGKYGQISAAYGMFYEDPSDRYLIYGDTHVKFQEATHYILNYQYMQNDRTFRVEGYYKSYNDLIREITQGPFDPNPYRPLYWPVDNSGYGYAKGIDVFWRDKKSIKNFDYWISYSYINTERLYQNYVSEAMPTYVSPDNLNIVTKYFFEKPGINLSLTYNYSSGRPYYNPNNPVFLGDRSPAYQDLSASLSYLFRIKKLFGVFYLGVDNVTNNKNILGYNYSDNGENRYPILPALYRSAFAGIFLSLTPFKKDEL